MKKIDIRNKFLDLRSQLTESEINEKSLILSDKFFNEIEIKEYIHIYLPIENKNEINTWIIIKRLQNEYPNTKIIVPVTDFKSKKMNNYLLKPETQLVISKYGIPEPVHAEKISNDLIEMVITPLLVMDHENYRVGYGGGFYDRFFQELNSNVLKIGLSLFPPIEKIDDLNAFDIALDKVIF